MYATKCFLLSYQWFCVATKMNILDYYTSCLLNFGIWNIYQNIGTTTKWIQVDNDSFIWNDSFIHESWSILALRKSHKMQIPVNPWKSLYPYVCEKWEMMIWIFSAKKISPRHDYFSPSHQWAILAFRMQYEYHSSTNGRKRL